MSNLTILAIACYLGIGVFTYYDVVNSLQKELDKKEHDSVFDDLELMPDRWLRVIFILLGVFWPIAWFVLIRGYLRK